MGDRYRAGLRDAVAGAAAPYGYTLTIWTTGAVTISERGLPDLAKALLFLAGAVAGFGVAGALAYGGVRTVVGSPSGARHSLWGLLHLPAVGIAIAGVALLAATVDGDALWGLAGFTATLLYLLGLAGELALSERRAG